MDNGVLSAFLCNQISVALSDMGCNGRQLKYIYVALKNVNTRLSVGLPITNIVYGFP